VSVFFLVFFLSVFFLGVCSVSVFFMSVFFMSVFFMSVVALWVCSVGGLEKFRGRAGGRAEGRGGEDTISLLSILPDFRGLVMALRKGLHTSTEF